MGGGGGQLTCSAHHTSIHLSDNTDIFGMSVWLAIHDDNCILNQICKSHL